uniref:Secreted protein n=1 Tax=Rhizophora mucronata TaxID=61149 RepID=A0A2P2KQK1_RHIMU
MFDKIVVWVCVFCCCCGGNGGVKAVGFEFGLVNVVVCWGCGCGSDVDDGSIGFGEASGFGDETAVPAMEAIFPGGGCWGCLIVKIHSFWWVFSLLALQQICEKKTD